MLCVITYKYLEYVNLSREKTRNIPETLNFETNDIISKHSLAFIKSFQFSEEKYFLFSKAISNGHVLH